MERAAAVAQRAAAAAVEHPVPLLLAMLAGMAWGMVVGAAGEACLERHLGLDSASPRASEPASGLAGTGFHARQLPYRSGKS